MGTSPSSTCGNELCFAEITAPAKPPAVERPNEGKRMAVATGRKWVQGMNHPGPEAERRGAQQKALWEALLAGPSLASPCASP